MSRFASPSPPAALRATSPRLLPRACASCPASRRWTSPGPGFLNIRLSTSALGQLALVVVEAGSNYGRNDALAGQRLNLEYVSANPTGPLHIGGTRWAAVGDALARILGANGAAVTREYYFNDHGSQVDRFARSLLASARGEVIPPDGYAGAYIHDIAARVVRDHPETLRLPRDDAQEVFRREGVELMFDEIKRSLHDFGVDFDVFFHENSLYESGAVDKVVAELKESGSLYFAEGAWWLRSSDYGDDKDRVVIRSDGSPAYIAGDLAYLQDKRARGFDLCIYMLGADHHGYIGRLKAAAAALGDDPNAVEVLIGQLVNLVKDGRPVRMGKRAGNVVTLEDLVEAVGVDAARYALERSSSDAVLDIDLDLLVKHSNDNPVYYVQYAHARTSNVRRNAAGVRHRTGRVRPQLARSPGRYCVARCARRIPADRLVRGRTARPAPSRALPRIAGRPLTTGGMTRTSAASCRRGTTPSRRPIALARG